MGIELETQRLKLRPLASSDGDFILVLLNEPSFLKSIGDRGVRSLEQARRYIEDGPTKSYERHGFGLLLVIQKDTGRSIGICGLLKREVLNDVDLGFALLPDAWGKGFAHEASQAVLTQGFDVLGFDRIVAIAREDNLTSIRLLEKLGFKFEHRVFLDQAEELLSLYALRRQDRNAQGPSP